MKKHNIKICKGTKIVDKDNDNYTVEVKEIVLRPTITGNHFDCHIIFTNGESTPLANLNRSFVVHNLEVIN